MRSKTQDLPSDSPDPPSRGTALPHYPPRVASKTQDHIVPPSGAPPTAPTTADGRGDTCAAFDDFSIFGNADHVFDATPSDARLRRQAGSRP